MREPLDDPQLARSRFWLTYLRLGFAVLTGEGLVATAYFSVEPGVGHRWLLVSITAATASGSAAANAFLPAIAVRAWRARFALGVGLGSEAVLGICCALHDGLDNPLLYLAALPIVAASLALSTRQVLLMSAAASAELGLLFASNPSLYSIYTEGVSLLALLGGASALSLVAAWNRTRLESLLASERALLVEQAATDLLTGCLNNGTFYARVEDEVERANRTGAPCSLVMADVDLFKSYNDTLGHPAGDELLAALGSTLRRTARRYDVVGRVGGDEFAILMPSTGSLAADTIGDRVVAAVARLEDGVTMSVGVSTLRTEDPTARRLVRDADEALYKAKASGRARAVGSRRFVGAQPLETPTDGPGFAENRLLFHRVAQLERACSESNSMLAATVRHAPIGVVYLDTEFKILMINEVFAQVNHRSVEEHLGRKTADVVPYLWPRLEPLFHRVLATGSPCTLDEAFEETASEPGRVHYWLATIFPVVLGGAVMGLGVVALDVTDREQLVKTTQSMTSNLVGALAATVGIRDPFTAGHQERVAQIAAAITADLGLDAKVVMEVEMVGRIHDLGKVGVPADILSRPAKLLPVEFELVKAHSQAGYDILASVGFPEHLRQMVLQHHERLDGSGYPQGLTGDQMSLGAKIIAVADVAEAMTAIRPYRPALGIEAACAELSGGRGRLYDGDVVDAFVRLHARPSSMAS